MTLWKSCLASPHVSFAEHVAVEASNLDMRYTTIFCTP